MATTNFDIDEITSGQSNTHTTHNDALVQIDSILGDITDIDTAAGGTISVTLAQYRNAVVLKLTGAPGGAFTLDLPAVSRSIIIHNTSGQTATVQTGTPGNTESLADAVISSFYSTGVNDVYKVV